jgi:hypothetical protein
MILCTCMQWITETATNFFIGRHELMLAKVERLGESLKFFTSMHAAPKVFSRAFNFSCVLVIFQPPRRPVDETTSI